MSSAIKKRLNMPTATGGGGGGGSGEWLLWVIMGGNMTCGSLIVLSAIRTMEKTHVILFHCGKHHH